MTDPSSPINTGSTSSLMDELLRTGVPEIKLGLGEVIDRENVRPLPAKYARLLPDTLLQVVLRADAAEALREIATDVERELTDSCNRHGSLYDRTYRVELQRSDDPDAPLFAVNVRAGNDDASGEARGDDAGASERGDRPAMPVAERESAADAPADASSGWAPDRWVLIVEQDEQAREAFRIMTPMVTVGRTAADPALRPTIAISNAPGVSRRQIVLLWQERDGAPGFRLYNIGLNAVHLPGREIAGARLRGDDIDLESVVGEHTGWLPPGVSLRIGEDGPSLRIEEVPPGPEDEVPIDPDATVFGI